MRPVTIAAFDKNGNIKSSMKVDEAWAERVEKMTKGKVRRLTVEEMPAPRRRRRKTGE